jgi:hypothetical protein
LSISIGNENRCSGVPPRLFQSNRFRQKQLNAQDRMMSRFPIDLPVLLSSEAGAICRH